MFSYKWQNFSRFNLFRLIITFYGHWDLRSLCRFLLVIHSSTKNLKKRSPKSNQPVFRGRRVTWSEHIMVTVQGQLKNVLNNSYYDYFNGKVVKHAWSIIFRNFGINVTHWTLAPSQALLHLGKYLQHLLLSSHGSAGQDSHRQG